MKIVCPACEAAYDVPPSVVASPRRMRCARCGQDWIPTAAEPDAPAAAAPEPAPPPEPPPAAPEPVHVEPPALPTAPVASAPVAEEVHADAPDIVPELELEPAPFVPPPPPPVEEDLVFVPASFTSFETLPPVIDPLVDPGFEPLILKPPVAPLPVVPLLHAVPPRAPGDIDPVLIDLPAYGSPGPSGLAVAVGWIASFVLLMAVGFVVWSFRDSIMLAWPPSQRLFAALGGGSPTGQ